MARNKLTPYQSKMVRELSTELYFAKVEQKTIVGIVGEKTGITLTQQQISYYVTRRLKEKHDDVDALRAEQIAICHWQLRQLSEAWEESKKNAETKTKKVSGKPGKDGKEKEISAFSSTDKTEGRIGDVRIMDAISRVMERLSKITGVSQEKVETTLRGGVVIVPDNKRNPDGNSDTT